LCDLLDVVWPEMSSSSQATTALAAAVLVVGALLAWEFLPVEVGVGSRRYELVVKIESPEGNPKVVAYSSFGSRESAVDAVEHDSPKSHEWESVIAPYDGRMLTVWVTSTTRTSPMGRVVSHSHTPFLGVMALLDDDRRVGRVVEIPTPGATNEILVVLSPEPGMPNKALQQNRDDVLRY
jgi:hypothetical protein